MNFQKNPMKSLYTPLILSASLSLSFLYAGEAPSDKTLKYHKALQSRPLNEQLFERFYSAWIEDQQLEAMEKFLAQGKDKSWQKWALLARYQMRRSLNEEAITSLGHAIAKAPDPSTLLQLRAELYVRNMDFTNAINDLKQIEIKDNEDSIRTIRLLGKCYLRVNQVDEALALWTEAIKSSDVGIDFVDAAATEGEFKKAIELCSVLIEKTKKPYENVLYRIRLAELQGRAEAHEDALTTLKVTLDDTGNASWLEADILRKADSLFDRQGDFAGQINFYKSLYAEHKHRLQIKRKYAFLLAHNDNWEEAEKLFSEMLLSAPDDIQLRKDYILLLTNSEKQTKALSELEHLIKQVGNDQQLLLQKVDLLTQLDRKDEVEAVIKTIDSIAGESESEQIRISQIYLQNGFKEQAEKILTTLAGDDSNLLAKESLASFFLRNERKEEALATLEKATLGADIESLIRITSNIAKAGAPVKAYDILLARSSEFSSDTRYLYGICQLAISSNNEDSALHFSEDILHLATRPQELEDAIKMALKMITRASAVESYLKKLEAKKNLAEQDRCLLAALYASSDEINKARELVTTDSPAELTSYFWASLLVQYRLTDEACEVLLKLVDSPAGRNAVFLRKLCQLQKSTGDFDAAYQTVKKWKEIAPNDKIAWIWESELLQSLGETGKSIANLRRATARFENAGDLFSLLSKQYLAAGMYSDAHQVLWKSFENATSVDSKIHWSRELVNLNYDLANLDELRNEFQKRRSGNNKSISPVLALIQIAIKEQDLDGEREFTKEALALQPNNEKLLLNLGGIEERLGNPKFAENYYKQAAHLSNAKSARNRLLKFYFRTGQEQKAFFLVKSKSDTSDPRKAENIAIEMYKLGYLEMAITSLEDFLVQTPNDWRLKYLYATLLEENNQQEEAAQHFMALSTAHGELTGVEAKEPNFYPASYPASYPRVLNYDYNAYRYRSNLDNLHHSQSQSLEQFFLLPNSVEELQVLAHTHLFNLMAIAGPSPLYNKILAHLTKEDVKEPEIVAEVIFKNLMSRGYYHFNDHPRFVQWLRQKNPDSALMARVYIRSSQGLDPDEAVEMLESFKGLKDIESYAASQLLLSKSSDENFLLGKEIISKQLKEKVVLSPQIFMLISTACFTTNDERSEERTKVLLDIVTLAFDQLDESEERAIHILSVPSLLFALTGDDQRLLKILNNKKLKDSVKNISANRSFEPGRTDFGHLIHKKSNNVEHLIEANLGYLQKKMFDNETVLPGLDRDAIKVTLRRIIPQIESKIIASQILSTIGEDEQSLAVLSEEVASKGDEMKAATLSLAFKLELEEKYSDALEGYIKYRKFATTPYTKALVDSRILQVAQKCEKEQTANHSGVLLSALTTFLSSPDSYLVRYASEFATKLDIKLPRVAVNKKMREKREPILQSINGTAYRDLHKRITPMVEAGQQDAAIRLSARLFAGYMHIKKRLPSIQDLFSSLKENQLEDAFLLEIEKDSSTSALKNKNYVFALHLLDRESKILPAINSLEDSRIYEQWNQVRLALQLYATDPTRAIELLSSATKEASESIEIPASITLSRKQWYNWGALVADYVQSLDKSTLKDQDMLWLVPVVSNIADSQRFFDGKQHISSIFVANTVIQKEQKRSESVSNIAHTLLSSQKTADIGFLLLMSLDESGKIAKADRVQWMQTYLMTGALTGDGVSDSRSRYLYRSWVDRYVRGKSAEFSDYFYRALKKQGSGTILPEAFLKKLKAQEPETATVIDQVLALSKLKGDSFKKRSVELADTWKKEKSSNYHKLADNLGNLSPYTKKRVKLELAKILTDLKKYASLDYDKQSKVMQRTISLLTICSEDISDAYTEEKYKEIVESILGDRSEWPDRNGSLSGRNGVEQICYRLTSVLLKQPELVAPILKASWTYELPLQDVSYDVIRLFTERTFDDPDSFIKFLEKFGLIGDVDEYFPLVMRTGNRQNFYQIAQVQTPLAEVSHHIRKQISGLEKWGKVVEALKKRKVGRFGALLTAACFTQHYKYKRALVLLALQENVDALLALPDQKLVAIYTNFKMHLPKSASQDNAKISKLMSKFEELSSREALTSLEKMIVNLDSGQTFSSSNNSSYIIYQTEKTAAQLLSSVVKSYPKKALQFVKSYEAAYSKHVRTGGSYSRSSSSNTAISATKDQLLEDTFGLLRQANQPAKVYFNFIAAVQSDKDLSEKLYWNYNTYYPLERARGSKKHAKKKQQWLYLDTMAKEFSALSYGAQSIAAAAIIHEYSEYTNSSSWSTEMHNPVIVDWLEKADESPIYNALSMVAARYCKPSEGKFERFKPFLISYLADKNVPDSFRLYCAADNLKNYPALIKDEEFNSTVIALNKAHLNGNRSARTSLQQELIEAYARAAKSQGSNSAAHAMLETWATSAKRPMRGEVQTIYGSLSKAAISLSVLTENHNTTNWLLGNTNGGIRGNTPIIITLIKGQQYAIAKRLLPLPGKLYQVTNKNSLYDKELETAVKGFKEFINNPRTSFRFECELLYTKDGQNDAAPEESFIQRTARLSKELVAIGAINREAKVEALVGLNRCRLGVITNQQLVADTVKGKSFDSLLTAYATNSSDKYKRWLTELYQFHAMNEMLKGNIAPLKSIVDSIIKADDDRNISYLARRIQSNMAFTMCYPLVEAVRSQTAEQLEAILPLLQRLAIHAHQKGYSVIRCCTSPLAYAKLVSHALGRRDELDSWGDNLTEEVKKKFDASMKRANIPAYIALPSSGVSHWLSAENKEYRIDLYKWVYANSEAANSMTKSLSTKSLSWAAKDVPGKGLTEAEAFELTGAEQTHPDAKKSLLVHRAWHYYEKKEYTKALADYAAAMTLMETPSKTWDPIYDDAAIYSAEIHLELDEKDKAVELAKSLRLQNISPREKKRRNTLLKKLGLLENS